MKKVLFATCVVAVLGAVLAALAAAAPWSGSRESPTSCS